MMKTLLLLALGLSLTGTGFSQAKKTKQTPAQPVAAAPNPDKDDTLLHRRAQVSSVDVSQTEDSRVPLLNGYALVLRQGENVKLQGGDATKMPYFLIEDKPATRQEVEALKAAEVTNVSLWKRQKATATYGDKAKHGAVILHLKKK
jgi:hypothetical protein